MPVHGFVNGHGHVARSAIKCHELNLATIDLAIFSRDMNEDLISKMCRLSRTADNRTDVSNRTHFASSPPACQAAGDQR